MEFHEKLQQLRRQHNLTQEQLAQQLFVSRTAVSKWESGRGYPNLESLKAISRLFSVSLDTLLSGDELLEFAETENRANISRLSALLFAVLDMLSLAFLFVPTLGQQDGEYIRAITVFSISGISPLLRTVYFVSLTLIPLFGFCELIIVLSEKDRAMELCRLCSLALCSAAILLFAISRQPYITALLFLLFIVKVVLMVHEIRSK